MARKVLIQIGFTERQRKYLEDKKECEEVDSISAYIRKLVEEDIFKCKQKV